MISKTATEIGKDYGFVFDNEILYDDDCRTYSGYLIATDNLMAKVGFALEKYNPSVFEDFLEGLKHNGEVPNFYTTYDKNKNDIELSAAVCYNDKNGHGVFSEITLPINDTEKEILLNTLNNYCLQKYNHPLVRTYDPSFEVKHSVEELHDRAYKLYSERSRDFSEFTNGELYELYKLCVLSDKNPYGQSYDDEVFDEIDSRNGVDGKELSDVFYEMYMKENYLDPAYKIVDECKDAYANGNMSLAYEKWSELHSFLIPEGIANASTDFQNKMYDFYSDCMNKFSDEEVYNITDYGKAHSYSEMEEER